MAFRVAALRSCWGNGKNVGPTSGFHKFAHAIAQPAPMDSIIFGNPIAPPIMALPENQERIQGNIGYGFQDITFFNGSMELMAVPKKKVSRHKRGIRNGPKALKPQPVIIRCTVCGRVKLPHFFCCGGIRKEPGQ
ncbi:unnamed protein product [Cuscuta campestris]|uniref:Large ribosomal subunit protein bL32m n=1 Tax=Cuscuta campestris TaxID=132261 RepID=A0A484M903_9ASTE|nr:unnamed protein product [Cuscuta campestris]